MFGRATIRLSIGPHSSFLTLLAHRISQRSEDERETAYLFQRIYVLLQRYVFFVRTARSNGNSYNCLYYFSQSLGILDTEGKTNNNNNNINQQHIYGAVIMAGHYKSSPGLFDECRLSDMWPHVKYYFYYQMLTHVCSSLLLTRSVYAR